MYYKIQNLINNGNPNYKGLDINMFIPFSQEYDYQNNLCVLETIENKTISNVDLTVLTKDEYEKLKNEIRSFNLNKPTEITVLKEKVIKLEEENATINYALMMGGLL